MLALSINSIESIQAFIFYLMQYSISNLNAFIILVTIGFSFYFYVTDNKEHKELLDKNNSPAEGYRKPLQYWVLWPNSGDLLKLLIPSYIRKGISGWANYLCMVISQKMIEREMEYRGSKSVICENLSVKEQRVDGHRCVKLTHLRYALMGFERNYQIKNLSNQINTLIRSYTSISTNLLYNLSGNLNP